MKLGTRLKENTLNIVFTLKYIACAQDESTVYTYS